MTPQDIEIAVIGGGLGGAALGHFATAAGLEAHVFERTARFQPLGAGIHVTPNVGRLLKRGGVFDRLQARGLRCDAFLSRDGLSGAELCVHALADAGGDADRAEYLTIHRGDLHRALVEAIAPGHLHFGHELIGLEELPDGFRLSFRNGRQLRARRVIGADGIHSRVRRHLKPDDAPPAYSGQAAFRGIVDVADLGERPTHDLTKWWAPDRFVIAYYIDRARSRFYFVAGFPQGDWTSPESSVPAGRDELLSRFSDFHPEVRAILNAAPAELRKWALFERAPDTFWHRGRIALIGDACHPMRPHMAQGAAMAIEDAAVLTRCLLGCDDGDPAGAYGIYARTRRDRTARVQILSGRNTWLRGPEETDWLYSHDAWKTPLSA